MTKDEEHLRLLAIFGWLFVAIGGTLFLVGQALAACVVAAGRAIAARMHYTFVFVVACVECIVVPMGTVLGVFTFLVLQRDAARPLFGKPRLKIEDLFDTSAHM
ncbi:hypothetical protein BH23VER1_BH23VER1_05750 [soil metagenome]